MAIIPKFIQGAVKYDPKKNMWLQSWIDLNDKIIWLTEYKGRKADQQPLSEAIYKYTYIEWEDLDWDRFTSVSRGVVENPDQFLEDKLRQSERPDPRVIDVKYAELVTNQRIDFFWRQFDHADDIWPELPANE